MEAYGAAILALRARGQLLKELQQHQANAEVVASKRAMGRAERRAGFGSSGGPKYSISSMYMLYSIYIYYSIFFFIIFLIFNGMNRMPLGARQPWAALRPGGPSARARGHGAQRRHRHGAAGRRSVGALDFLHVKGVFKGFLAFLHHFILIFQGFSLC